MTLGAPAPWSAPAAADAEPEPAAAPGKVVVFGIPGLTMEDIDPELTPHLYSLVADGAAANLNVRTIGPNTCPASAWLSLGSGARATAGGPSDAETPASCPPFIDPGDEALTGAEATLEDFGSVTAPNAGSGYAVDYGMLARAVGEAPPPPGLEACVAAEGPGAAYAVADAEGVVRDLTTDAAGSDCRLGIVDLGSVGSHTWLTDPLPDTSYTVPVDFDRSVRVAAADRLLGEHLDDLRSASAQSGGGAEPTIVVAGLGDSSAVPRLRGFVMSGPGIEPGTVTSTTTRTPALLQLTDLAPGILNLMDVPSPSGISFDVTASDADPADRLADLVTDARKAATIHQSLSTFSLLLDVMFYCLFVLCGVLLTAAVVTRRGGARVHVLLAWMSLVAASVPMGAFLAGLFPWARFDLPQLGLGISVAVGSALMLGASLLPPWGRTWRGRVAALALTSVLVIAVDLVTGSRLQGNSLLGYNPIVGGRFYGLGNQGAAVLIVSLFVFLGLAISRLRAGGHARLAITVPVVAGAAAVFVSGNPSWGAKFGGTIATLAGLLVLLALVARIRLSLLRLALIGLASLAVLLGIAFLDWLRPPGSRSHFGAFFDQLVSGEALRVIGRKLAANLHIIQINPALAIVTPLAVVAILFFLRYLLHFPRVQRFPSLVRFTGTWRGRLPEVFEDEDVHFGFLAAVTGLAVGLVLTDSGIAVPSTGAMVLLPFLLALSAEGLGAGRRAPDDATTGRGADHAGPGATAVSP
ncbi:hypothetical protein DFO66_101415 [Brevibacterium sanguinis]|uniref:Uncharacterized protein n=3 Tax=Brevibacteriaceae TaxID=85019 RepID=A0A366IQ51_9MICO|nr:hypothetical protein DFO66_101415 [Brevibacterium sanguinis]RBP74396.1 hypothetical protein DFO65_101114 [Brevibacterium celere]